MGNLKIFVCSLITASLLSACGGGGSSGGLTGSGANQGEVGAAHTVTISFPTNDAISQLDAPESGFYQHIATATVTDKNGNAVKDGTEVQFDVIDSIIAYGTIGAADSLTGLTLNDANPLLSDNATVTTLSSAYINHSGEIRKIEVGDLVLLTANADKQDQIRYVSADPTASSLSLSTAYSQDYPNATYAAGTTTYLVGTSRLGASIYGVDENGNETEGVGRTKDGLISLYIKYPANENTIWAGCVSSASDTRYATPGGYADTYVVARIGSTDVSVITDEFCFSAIAPATLTLFPASVSTSGSVVSGKFEDASNVGLPFATFTATGVVTKDTDGSITAISATNCVTGVGGTCTSTVTITGKNSDDTAEIHYTNATYGIDSKVDVK